MQSNAIITPDEYVAQLQAEVKRLRQENLKLRQRLQQCCRVINNQKRQIDAVRSYAWGMQQRAQAELAKLETEHNSKGRYSYIKGLWTGRGDVAGAVFGLVFVDFATAVLDTLQELGICK